jgi:hypothetical protein
MGTTAAIIGLFVLIFGISIVRSRRQMSESMSWPATGAKILHSAVEYRSSDEGGAYYPQVYYEYIVNGQTYRNNRIRFGMQMGFGAASISQNVVNKYPVETIQAVYYNPIDPTQSVLDRSTGGANKILGCVIVFMIGLFVFIGGIVLISTYGSQMLQQTIKSIMP